MNISRTFLVAFLLIGISACIESESPLSAPDKPDTSVAGLWVSHKDKNNTVYLHVIVDINKQMKLVKVTHPLTAFGAIGGAEQYEIFPTWSGTETFMNVSFPASLVSEGEKHTVRYLFIRYRIFPNDTLHVWHISSEKLRAAIDSGSLKGKAWDGRWGSNVILTDSSANLLKYITAHPDIWSEEEVFRKVSIN